MRFEELDRSHRDLFLKFIADLAERDRSTLLAWLDREWNELTFTQYARECELARLDWRPKAGQVSTTTYLLIDALGIAGFGLLRFPLTPEVEFTGGNFVFIVPPARRRQGLGPVILNRLLFEGARAGLARALVTCPVDQEAARRCIKANRGESAGVEDNREKFWIPLR